MQLGKHCETIEQFEKEVISRTNSVVKDILYAVSTTRAMFVEARRAVMAKSGEQGGGLASVIVHMSYAPQRWETKALVLVHWCLCLIAWFLVGVGEMNAAGTRGIIKIARAETFRMMSTFFDALGGMLTDYYTASEVLVGRLMSAKHPYQVMGV